MNLRAIDDAKRVGAWTQVVELEKAAVRGGCQIESRWIELVNALLQAHRQTEAVQAMQDMDSRGFDLSRYLTDSDHPAIKNLMNSPPFLASTAGRKITSNQRRIRFREVLKSIPPNQRPPENYIAKGACPFECCQYGRWTVLKDTILVAAPGSKRTIGMAKKGSRATGLTGEVHLKPEPVVVVFDGVLPKDSIVFILDSGGEGSGRVYAKGKIIDTFLWYAEYCLDPSEVCWGETLLPPNERKKPVWWVKVRLPNGLTGWTDQTENFGGMDACG